MELDDRILEVSGLLKNLNEISPGEVSIILIKYQKTFELLPEKLTKELFEVILKYYE